ncbi:MAG: hypothetical protein ACI4J1_04645 [Ruminiclostridium sp.]
MKTLEELYREVIASEDLKKEFLALKPEEVESFAEKYGCKATLDEIKAFLTERSASGELSDEEINQVAGGKSADLGEAGISLGTWGVGCAIKAIYSAIEGKCGTAIEGQGMLCALS